MATNRLAKRLPRETAKERYSFTKYRMGPPKGNDLSAAPWKSGRTRTVSQARTCSIDCSPPSTAAITLLCERR